MRNSSVDLTILNVLDQQKSHLSANQVFEEIRNRLPAVNPSTVYRSLDRLANMGKISISDMGTGAVVYELVECCGPHHHLVCQKCGTVVSLPMEIVQPFIDQVETTQNYKVTTNHLVLFGVCLACRESQS